MSKKWWVLLAVAGLIGSVGFPVMAGDAGVNIPETVCGGSPHGKQLCAVRLDSGELEWQLRQAGAPVQRIGTTGNEGQVLAEITPDQSFEYVAIITAEEGHPMLGVYSLQDWVARQKQPDALYFLNPYPGTLSVERWKKGATTGKKNGLGSELLFSSDGPVLTAEKYNVPGYVQPDMQNYKFNISTGKVERNAD